MAGHCLKLLNSPYPRLSYQIYEKTKFPYSSKFFLPEPLKSDISYSEVISSRESRRIFNSPLNLPELSSILWDTMKIKKINVNSSGTIIWNHRGAPSSGGLASIDVFIINIADLPHNVYCYNPFDHSLEQLELKQIHAQNFIDEANKLVNAQNATLFVYAVETTNLFSKYENAESLIWRDVGAIYAIANLAATSLELNSCPLGATFHPLFSDMLECKKNIISIGGQVFGH